MDMHEGGVATRNQDGGRIDASLRWTAGTEAKSACIISMVKHIEVRLSLRNTEVKRQAWRAVINKKAMAKRVSAGAPTLLLFKQQTVKPYFFPKVHVEPNYQRSDSFPLLSDTWEQ